MMNKKVGNSVGITFSKEQQLLYGIDIGDTIDFDLKLLKC